MKDIALEYKEKFMRIGATIAICGGLAILLLGASPLFAEETSEWLDLFDGKTLDGWQQLNGTAKYEVRDGMIVGTTVPGSPNSFLCTKKDYGDFVLELDFKVDEGLNSGVQIRSQSLKQYKDGRVHGYQVEIDPAQEKLYSKNPPNLWVTGEEVPPGTEPRRWTGGIYDEARRGWLCNLTRNVRARNAFMPGEWNHFRIEAMGDSIQTWLNGVPAANIVDSMTANGFIALQVHSTKEKEPMQVCWKNIRIQDMGFNKAKPDTNYYPDVGDWQASEAGLVAQVFSISATKRQANLFHAFDTAHEPISVLDSVRGPDSITFSGNGWTGAIESERFKVNKGKEKFEMRRVTRLSPTLNALPPKGAVVLFDGTNLDEWARQKEKEWDKVDGPADGWTILPGGRLEPDTWVGSIITKMQFGDFKLHLEFRVPGGEINSGVYLHARYEVNINDSYGLLEGSQCGALSNLPTPVEPRVHMAAPALQWQTYDIDFRAPRFDTNGTKIEKARVTVAHNGVTIHDRVELDLPRGAAKRLGETPIGPIMLQEHGVPLQFRNIWIVDKGTAKGQIGKKTSSSRKPPNRGGKKAVEDKDAAQDKAGRKTPGNRKPPNRGKGNSERNKIDAGRNSSSTSKTQEPAGEVGSIGQNETSFEFPANRPENGNFNRPGPGDILDVSPPGFCWWRAGKRGELSYRLQIHDSKGRQVYASALLNEPVHVPDEVLPAGIYTWTVEGLTPSGFIAASRPPSAFTISENALPLPWVAPRKLLSRVPKEHPRLLFPKAQLPDIRKTLDTTLKAEFSSLKAAADEALDFPLVKEADFDKYVDKKQYAIKRTAYREAFHEVGNAYLGGVVPLALTYALTLEKKYGEAAKAHILNLLDWELDGVMSVQDPRFDEVGLRIARALPQGYDWCYDLFSEKERIAVEEMIVGLGNKLLERMQRRDFLNTPAESHDGRVPGYVVEFAIALAERPEAEAWMDYGMKSLLTVFPHWAGRDGGWAEGVGYALTYNDRFITPLQSVYTSTGYDIWQKPFFRKFPYFLLYCISPKAEITPFGDQEHLGIVGRSDKLRTMLLFYALRNQDSGMRWWVDLLGKGDDDAEMDGPSAIRSMILPDTVVPAPPKKIPPDRAFKGIGWVALHSDLAKPDDDLMVFFKSSPYGSVSHSHLDQNTFAILKGGSALAMPAGARYPQHGSPFHTEYTRLTVAHNALLINGKGQIDRDEKANGLLAEFQTMPHIGYASGEAQNCYGKPVTRYVRHIVLVRPSLVLVADDLEASEQVQVEWLMHAKERFDLNEKEQTFVSHRNDAFMKVHLLTPGGFDFRQDDAWPVDPRQGYPMVTTEPPAKQWHFNARRRERSERIRIAAIMAIGDGGDQPECKIRRTSNGTAEIIASFAGIGQAKITVDLSADRAPSQATIEIHYELQKGETEYLSIP